VEPLEKTIVPMPIERPSYVTGSDRKAIIQFMNMEKKLRET
jgi:hypothetical protein